MSVRATARQRVMECQGEVREACMEYVDDIVWSTGMPKREAAERAGFNVKVWIDDMPEMIVSGPRA